MVEEAIVPSGASTAKWWIHTKYHWGLHLITYVGAEEWLLRTRYTQFLAWFLIKETMLLMDGESHLSL